MRIIDFNNWKRKEHFNFFSQFDDPFFSLTSNVDCTNAYNLSSEKGISFFAYYLYLSLIAANDIPEFRYRIINNEVIEHDIIHASPTIGRDDETFGIGYVPFNPDFYIFQSSLIAEKQRINNISGLGFNDENIKDNVIHYSSIPWVSFKGLTHPRNFKIVDSVPKISFGRMIKESSGKKILPVSIFAHHGLMDGVHMGKYLEKFDQLLKQSKLSQG